MARRGEGWGLSPEQRGGSGRGLRNSEEAGVPEGKAGFLSEAGRGQSGGPHWGAGTVG